MLNTTQMATAMRAIAKPSNRNLNTDYQQIAQQYLDLVSDAVMASIRQADHQNPGVFINVDAIRKALPRYTDTAGNTQYWFYWLRDNYPLYTLIQAGYDCGGKTKQYSKVALMNPEKYQISTSELYQQHCEAYIHLGIDPHPVPVDITSIQHYQSELYHRLCAEKYSDATPGTRDTWQQNIRICTEVIRLAEYTQQQYDLTEPTLLQFYKPSEFGRQYAQGRFALDRTPTELREAILGTCYKYDIRTSVFAVYLTYLKTFRPDLNITSASSRVCEYVHNRENIRNRLVELLCHTGQPASIRMRWVKEVITAIGFGANLGSNWRDAAGVWHSNGVRDIIRNQADYQAFCSDLWVKQFLSETETITDIILEHMCADADLSAALQNLWANNPNRNRKSLAMSWLYQHSETDLINTAVQAGHTENRPQHLNLLITLHDGFYTRKPIASGSASQAIRAQSEYVVLERSEINRWHSSEHTAETQHRARLANEQRLASGYQGVAAEHTTEPHRHRAYGILSSFGFSQVIQHQDMLKSDPDLSEYVTDWILTQCITAEAQSLSA